MKIEMVCAIFNNGRYFADFLRETGELLKSSNHDISWRCVVDKGSKPPAGFTCLGKQSKTKSPAINHARALNLGASCFESDYIALIDSDIAFLRKDWDEIMIDNLKSCDSFGVSHKDKFYRYNNYPVCQFMAFNKKVMESVNWDFLPSKLPNGSLRRYKATEKDSKICGVPVGTLLKKDTGWKVPYLLHDKGYFNSFVMDLVSVSSGNNLMSYSSPSQKKYCQKVCSDKLIHAGIKMAEYHYKGSAYCTHFGGSRKVIKLNKEARVWTARVRAYLQKVYG